jgi:hypothetical protein
VDAEDASAIADALERALIAVVGAERAAATESRGGSYVGGRWCRPVLPSTAMELRPALTSDHGVRSLLRELIAFLRRGEFELGC